MDEETSTDGMPSSDLFNYTASYSEYLTDIQSTTTSDVIYFEVPPIKIKSDYNDLTPIFEESGEASILSKKPFDFIKTKNYLEYIQSDNQLNEFSEILEVFLLKYFEKSNFIPIKCKLMMFIFPGEEYFEPMIRITYPSIKEFNNLKIKDDIEQKLKISLVNNSKNLEEFKALRNIQKIFRFVIRRE